MAPLRILFFGSPDPAKEILEVLAASQHEVVGVVTQPDKRRGRGKNLMPTPVKELANSLDIKVFEPNSKAELDEVVTSVKADIGVVVAYGRIVSSTVLNHFELGCINVHYSVLPQWRGAAPVERSILAGDETTGVSIMKMEEGLDTGPVYLHRRVDILPTTNTQMLFRSINAVAGELLLVVLDHIREHEPTAQTGEPSYAHKLDASDFYFDSNTSVVQIDRKIRAGALVKGAWTNLGEQKFRIVSGSKPTIAKVDATQVGTIDRHGKYSAVDGYLQLEQIQMSGKQVMDFDAWANGVSQDKFPLKIDR